MIESMRLLNFRHSSQLSEFHNITNPQFIKE